MRCLSICDVLFDICSTKKVNEQIQQETLVQIWVDKFGNLNIVDPEDELIPTLTDGNLSGSGTRSQRFYLDRFGNFKYTIP